MRFALIALLLCLPAAAGTDLEAVAKKMAALIAHGDRLAKAGNLDGAIRCYEGAVELYESTLKPKPKAAAKPVRKSRYDPPAGLAHLEETDAATRKKIDELISTMLDPNAGRASLRAKAQLVQIGKPAFPRILGAMAQIRDTITDVDSHEERLVESGLKLADEALREMDGWLDAKNKSTLRPGSEKRYIAYILRLHYKRWTQTLLEAKRLPGPYDPEKETK